MRKRMQVEDNPVGYGWISIALHWTTGIIIMVMLVVGSLTVTTSQVEWARMLALHTTIGVLAYPLLWARIFWRLKKGHPGPLPTQSPAFHLLGRFTHYVMLGGLGLMLLSGPATAWSAGYPVVVLGFSVLASGEPHPAIFQMASLLHHAVGLGLLLLIVLHVAAAIKHMAVDRDGTIEKIILAGPELTDASTSNQL
ncbi:MAG: cytochrome b/b6 domain-containing protein [Novosphingobium sp.]